MKVLKIERRNAMSKLRVLFFLILFCSVLVFGSNPMTKIKDITTIKGNYSVNLVGYGIVVGLDGTGDGSKSIFTVQSIANTLQHFGINVDKNQLKPKNVAAVMVTANLSTYNKAGTKIDATVSSIGDAKSLQGGNLLITPLVDPMEKGKEKIYATASGPISIGGFNISTGSNSNFRKNYSLVGRIPNGVLIENQLNSKIINQGEISLFLKNPDNATAVRTTRAINSFLGEELAYPLDKTEIRVSLPQKYNNDKKVTEFIALLEDVKVQPAKVSKIVVNERTGTIVIGEDVKLNPVAISHGNLSIKINSDNKLVQPNPLTAGQTENQLNQTLDVSEDKAKVIENAGTTTLRELVESLNKIGVTPRDMISIFQALKEAGALQAELVLI